MGPYVLDKRCLFVLITQSFLQATVASIKDFTCVRTALLFPNICDTGIGVLHFTTPEEGTINIGLITNSDAEPFDTSRMHDGEKQVEKFIFDENKQAGVASHITLAVVTMLSRTIDDSTLSANVGLEDLRGAYRLAAKFTPGIQPEYRLHNIAQCV